MSLFSFFLCVFCFLFTHRLISKVTDDEGVQQKAFQYGWQVMHMRGVSESETSHPCWNAFKKAISHAHMTMDVMKLTLICTSPGSLHVIWQIYHVCIAERLSNVEFS